MSSLDDQTLIDRSSGSGADTSAENGASIMFELERPSGATLLFTGDGNGWNLRSFVGTGKRKYSIMKVAHHGAQRNNTIRSDGKFHEGIRGFFEQFSARQYVISGESVVSPTANNPDTVRHQVYNSRVLVIDGL